MERRKIKVRWILIPLFLVVVFYLVSQIPPILTAYSAKVLCSRVFISGLDPELPPDRLDEGLAAIEEEITQLTRQAPYTLLMMRVVEIGLPILLSVFSLFFVLRYTLTEKRSFEIKELLKQRNLARSQEENNID